MTLAPGESPLKPGPRPDWFVWNDPSAAWRVQHAEVPGLQWIGDGSSILAVQLHRSHLPLLPFTPPVETGFRLAGFAGATPADDSVVLRPYQAEDIPWLVSRRGSILAYQMRLGKTVSACLAHDAHDGPLLVVGPLAARDVWRTWIERVHGMPPYILKGTSIEDPPVGYPAYFIHYEILDAWTRFFVNAGTIGTLVLDECHLLMNRKAQRTSAASGIFAPRAERIIGLSGTPMWDRPDSMYSVLHLVSPGAWGGHHAFGVRYADGQPGAHGWSFKGLSNEEEFKARLGEVVRRRTWADVRPDLPKVIPVVEPVALSVKQRTAIDSAALTASMSRATTTVAGYEATLRRLLGEAKVEAAADAAQGGLRDGHKVVVWYWHNKVGDGVFRELGKRKVPTFAVRSADSADAREQQIRNFRACSGPAALVIGIAIGGTAIDLSCSDYAIFAELDWIPLNVQQAAMRTFSPDRPHALVILYADHEVEQKLVEVLGVKEDFANRLDLSADDIAKAVLG